MFTLENAAKRCPGNYVRMRAAQMNARAVGRVFNPFPETVFLVAGDGSVELPDEDRRFHTDVIDSSLIWTCDGDSSKPVHQGSQWGELGEFQPGTSGSFQYAYQPTDEARQRESTDSSLRKRRKREHTEPRPTPDLIWIKKIEICTFQGSQLNKWFDLAILLTKSTATVDDVAECVSEEAFDGDQVVLLDSENVQIEDSSVTRGVFSLLVICGW